LRNSLGLASILIFSVLSYGATLVHLVLYEMAFSMIDTVLGANNGAQTCLRATSARGFAIGIAVFNALVACINRLFDDKHTFNIRKESNNNEEGFEDHDEALAESVVE
jgi:hypothetical protein